MYRVLCGKASEAAADSPEVWSMDFLEAAEAEGLDELSLSFGMDTVLVDLLPRACLRWNQNG